jgi:hypothetical protein
MTCNGCRFCCWAFNIEDIPDSVKGLDFKNERSHCKYECEKGCELHFEERKPQTCSEFTCPYLQGKDICRPDRFQPLLEELNGDMGNYIPAIPTNTESSLVETTIRDSRSLPAFILIGNEWVRVILPLDRNDDKTWKPNEQTTKLWEKLLKE